jgi:hypothetical protein
MSIAPDELQNSVIKWLEGQGYPLEMSVALAFQKAGFNVGVSDYYKA